MQAVEKKNRSSLHSVWDFESMTGVTFDRNRGSLSEENKGVT